jgi:hypothetical protein
VKRVVGSVALALVFPATVLAQTPSPTLTSSVNRVSLATGDVVQLAPDTDVNERIAATPTGGRVAYTTADALWLSDGSPESARLLSAADGTTSSEAGTRELAWSGDGRRLAIGSCVVVEGICAMRVSVIEISTGRRFTLPFSATSPSLSPTVGGYLSRGSLTARPCSQRLLGASCVGSTPTSVTCASPRAVV